MKCWKSPLIIYHTISLLTYSKIFLLSLFNNDLFTLFKCLKIAQNLLSDTTNAWIAFHLFIPMIPLGVCAYCFPISLFIKMPSDVYYLLSSYIIDAIFWWCAFGELIFVIFVFYPFVWMNMVILVVIQVICVRVHYKMDPKRYLLYLSEQLLFVEINFAYFLFVFQTVNLVLVYVVMQAAAILFHSFR